MSGEFTNLRSDSGSNNLTGRSVETGPQPPNAYYIFPSNQRLDKYAIVISGDEDQYTGRDRILSATGSVSVPTKRTDGKASSVFLAELVPRTRQPPSLAGFELIDAPPSWHRSAPMLEYHVKYAQGFVFVFNMTSQETLDLAREMCDAVMHTASALGLIGDGKGPGSIPVILVGNVDKDLRRRQDIAKEGLANSRARDRTTTASIRAEAVRLAERWGCELFLVDTGNVAGLSGGGNEAFSALTRKIEENRRNHGSGVVYGFSETKPPQRLLIRRTVGRILPGALLKLFAK